MERLGDMPDMRLTGLVRNADLNGRLVALLDFTDGRWDVVTSDGTRLRVLPANLEPDEEGHKLPCKTEGFPKQPHTWAMRFVAKRGCEEPRTHDLPWSR